MFIPTVKSKYGEDISILVKKDNHPWNYLCECGEAKDLTVKELQNTKAIFISHMHIDHFINFDSVIRHQIGIQRKVIICGPKGIAKQIQSKILGYTWNLIDKEAITYEIREVVSENKYTVYQLIPPLWELQELETKEGNIVFEETNFYVSTTLLDHKIPTLAYKFQEHETVKMNLSNSKFKGGKWVKELKDAFENNKENEIVEIEGVEYTSKDLFYLLEIQKGDSLGVIMDHAPSKENHDKIISHFKKCNTVFIESFYLTEDSQLAEINYHSYSKMSGEVMRKSEVQNAIPVHFSRKYKEEDIEILIKEFNTAYTKQL